MAVIGLDLGGTKLSGAIFNDGGRIVKKVVLPLERRGGDDAGSFIAAMISSLVETAGTMKIRISAAGCCVPGIAYVETGRVWAPNIAGWDDYPLLEKLTGSIPDDTINIYIDNDRACSILGEVWQGGAKGCKNVIFLAIGTGIGAGIISDGNIIRGANDIAGSIGWLALDKPYLEKYTGIGCFEYHAAGEGLVRVARELLKENAGYSGMLGRINPDDLTAHSVFEAYIAHDVIARAVLSQAVQFWGMAVANLVSIFNPEKIIFGGGIFGPAAGFLDDIMAEAAKWAQPISIRKVKLEISSLGSDAGLYGAAYLGLSQSLKNS